MEKNEFTKQSIYHDNLPTMQDIIDSMIFLNTPKRVPTPPKVRQTGWHVSKRYEPEGGWETVRSRKSRGAASSETLQIVPHHKRDAM